MHMNDNKNQRDPILAEMPAPEPRSTDHADRRRRLLKSISGGGSILLATSQVKAWSTVSTCKQCTISGMQSAYHSCKPGESSLPCGGYSPGYWGQHWNKDSSTPARPWPVTSSTKLKALLQQYSIYTQIPNSVSLFELMGNPTYANTNERHWIGAWLNAQRAPTGYLFPYTAQQVMGFWKSGNGNYTSADMLQFFKDYFETHN